MGVVGVVGEVGVFLGLVFVVGMVGVVGVVGVEIVAYGWDRLEYGIDHLVGVWVRGGPG